MLHGIVIRQLPESRPVTLCLLKENKKIVSHELADGRLPEREDPKQVIESFKTEANQSVKAFKERFVEFNAAAFYLDVIGDDGELIETHVL